MDQAGTLRTMSASGAFDTQAPSTMTRVITITSGKGGVGKTNVVTNLAIALARAGKRVMIFDADLGLANIDVVLGLNCKYNLSHVLNGEKTLDEIITRGPEGIQVLPASSGVQELSELADDQRAMLLSQLESLNLDLDYVLIDTAAGIHSNVTYFNIAAHESIVVVTPEPTSITDAYALIKVLNKNYDQKRFHILVNMTKNESHAVNVYQNLTTVSDRYLTVSLNYLGFLPKDTKVNRAVLKQRAILDCMPEAPFSEGIQEVSGKIINLPVNLRHSGNPGVFWRQIFESPVLQRA